MSIAPIVQSVTVPVPPDRAFAMFTGSMGRWWQPGKTIGKQPHVAIVIEPRAGGRWFEQDADGNQTDWGHVLAWEPPGLVLLAWQLNASFDYDPELVTEVEITFSPAGDSTRVTLSSPSACSASGPAVARVEGSSSPSSSGGFTARRHSAS